MASLPYPRRHQTIFPQNPTQPNHLCASVKSVGGSSPPEASVNSVDSVGGLQCWCTSARLVQRRPLHPLGGRRGYGRDAIPSYDRSVGGVATQRGHGGMPCPLMSLFCGCTVCLVGAAETAAPPKNSATCLVGALLALASGKAERRQVHPLKDYLTSTFLTLPSAVRTMFRPFWSLESLTPLTVKSCASPLAAWMPLIAVSEFSL